MPTFERDFPPGLRHKTKDFPNKTFPGCSGSRREMAPWPVLRMGLRAPQPLACMTMGFQRGTGRPRRTGTGMDPGPWPVGPHEATRAPYLLGGQSAERWNNPGVFVTMDAERRLGVPPNLAPALPGDTFESRFDPEEDGIISARIKPDGDWLAVVAACLAPIDNVPPRRTEIALFTLPLNAPHRNHPNPLPSP